MNTTTGRDELDIDEMAELFIGMAATSGVEVSTFEAMACCLQMIRDGEVPVYNPSGQTVEIHGLSHAAFLDDIVRQVQKRFEDVGEC